MVGKGTKNGPGRARRGKRGGLPWKKGPTIRNEKNGKVRDRVTTS